MDKSWRRIKQKRKEIKYVATDMSAAFITSVFENCPKAVHVFDHFHVVKLMNDKLDDIRRVQYSMEKDINKRQVLKGIRYLLLSNGKDIFGLRRYLMGIKKINQKKIYSIHSPMMVFQMMKKIFFTVIFHHFTYIPT